MSISSALLGRFRSQSPRRGSLDGVCVIALTAALFASLLAAVPAAAQTGPEASITMDDYSTPLELNLAVASDGSTTALLLGTVSAQYDTNGNENIAFTLTTDQAGNNAAANFTISSTYTMTDGDGDRHFDGAISYTGTGETRSGEAPHITLYAFANDADGSSNVVTTNNRRTIEITLVDNRVPSFSSANTYSMNLSAGSSNVEIGTLAASDPDGDAVTFSLSGTTKFTIGASSGKVTYSGTGELLTDPATIFTFTAQISDGKALDGSADSSVDAIQQITVTVKGNRSPSFSSTNVYDYDINASTPGNVIPITLGTLAASDSTGDPITFSLTTTQSGSTQPTKFSIGSSTGILTYVGSGETTLDDLTFWVHASDGFSNSGQSDTSADVSQEITVTVNGNAAPVLSLDTYRFNLILNVAGNGTFPLRVGSVSATDAEGDTIAYSLRPTGGAYTLPAGFVIDSSTGVITYTGAALTSAATYTLHVRVCDGADAVYATQACSGGTPGSEPWVDDTATVTVTAASPAYAHFPAAGYSYDLYVGTPGPKDFGSARPDDPGAILIAHDAQVCAPFFIRANHFSYDLRAVAGVNGNPAKFEFAGGGGSTQDPVWIRYTGTGESTIGQQFKMYLAVRDYCDPIPNTTPTKYRETDEVPVVVTVRAIPTPTFSSTSYSYSLNAGVPGNVFPVGLGSVSATSAAGLSLTYSLHTTQAGSTNPTDFRINSSTGRIEYTGSGESSAFTTTLYAKVSDGKNSSGGTDTSIDATVPVTVTGNANTAPVFGAKHLFGISCSRQKRCVHGSFARHRRGDRQRQ